VLSSAATAVPNTADGTVGMIRQVKIAKDTATKARSQAIIALKGNHHDGAGRTPRNVRTARRRVCGGGASRARLLTDEEGRRLTQIVRRGGGNLIRHQHGPRYPGSDPHGRLDAVAGISDRALLGWYPRSNGSRRSATG
jgi:hypothetical protein